MKERDITILVKKKQLTNQFSDHKVNVYIYKFE